MEKNKLSYFLRKPGPQYKEFEAPSTIKDEDDKPVMIKVRVLTQEEIDKIIENYTTKHTARDGKKKTPIVQNGVLVEKQDRNSGSAMRHLVAEAIVDPDLKSQAAMDFFECWDMSEIIYKVFPTPDEYNYVVNKVLEILGLSNDNDDEDDVEKAKN